MEKSILLDELFVLSKVDKADKEQLLNLDENFQIQMK